MVIKLLAPKMRFVGWEPMGCFRRAVDERTVDELRESIGLWARRVPEVKQILPELDHMNPKHFGLVADTIELSQRKANSYLDVDMMEEFEFPPYSALDLLMAQIPIASRKAPNALDFAQEVINYTGKLTSKFFLRDAAQFDLLTKANLDVNYKYGLPLVENFAHMAERTPLDETSKFVKQEEFMENVFAITDENVIVEKIPLLKEIFAKIKGGAPKIFDMDKFLSDATPIKVIKANIETLQAASNYSYSFGKYLDVNSHLTKDPKDTRVYALDRIPSYMINDGFLGG